MDRALPTVIETERLILRPFQMEDVDAIHARMSDPEVVRYTGDLLSYEETRDLLQRSIHKQPLKAPFGNLAIVLKSNQYNIGYCGLNDLPQAGDAKIEVSYGLNRDYWGHGYATEAATAMLRFGFETVKLPEIVAAINPKNTASIRVAEKIGFHWQKKIQWPQQGQVDLYGTSRNQYLVRRSERMEK